MYLATHYAGTLPEPGKTLAQAMDDFSPVEQRKNAEEIYNFLTTQGNDLRDLSEEYTLFTALLSAPSTHQVKVVYGMGVVTARIGKTSPIAGKILMIYGEGGPHIVP